MVRKIHLTEKQSRNSFSANTKCSNSGYTSQTGTKKVSACLTKAKWKLLPKTSELVKKVTSFSYCRIVLLSIACVVIFACVGVGFDTFASDPDLLEAENQETTTDGTLETKKETTEDGESLADKELFEELLTFQRLLEHDEESNPEYADDTRCIDTRRMRHYDVLSGRFVVFEMRHSDEIYLVQFEQKCPGLQKNESLTFDIRSGQSGRLCVNDHIKPLDGNLSTQPGMRGGNCRIPSIDRITNVQLLQLERGLASNRVE